MNLETANKKKARLKSLAFSYLIILQYYLDLLKVDLHQNHEPSQPVPQTPL